ncbi:glycosyltransferase family 4 protein [Winogradskyella sp.]|uniref:glycosyltransferase family 4 protein n=1 Tax=Winogradskyella sp. TaxID=1883156 RepID=UPI00261427CE|nr:glycosyltransferase family 4 protein [Winogradskyella sp.]
MKILYVTELWSGFEDFIVNGKTEITGMPSFMKPLKYFLESEELDIDFVVIGKDKRDLNINVDWLKRSNFFWVNNKSFLKIFALRKIITSGKYDFVYGQGEAGGWGNIACILTKTPFGIRYYGTFLARHLNDSYLRFAMRNLLATVTYNIPKKFMLITNDGTKGDLVYQKLCVLKKLYTFNFWLNGVEKNEKIEANTNYSELLKSYGIKESDTIFLYPARYDPWKRQDLAIDILNEINKKYAKAIKLVFCGHQYNKEYLNTLEQKSKQYNLTDNIIFMDAVDAKSLRSLTQNASIVFSLYDLSNLGNVLIEASLRGALIFTLDDGTTSFLVEDGVTGISIKKDKNFVSNAASRIIEVLQDEQKSGDMKSKIRLRAQSTFLTWQERAQKEKELILASIKQ